MNDIEKVTIKEKLMDGTTQKKEIFVETVIETKTVERNLDQIESQITQKQNTIIELQNEVETLLNKKTQILSIAK
jgi:cell division protein FtsL